MARTAMFAMVVAGLVACGDNELTTIHVHADGARWMAVRSSPEAAWERFDGEDVTFVAGGVFEVAVVCREDIGDGFTLRASPDDRRVFTDTVCSARGGVLPQFAITGRADAIFVGYSASYLPNIVGQDIAPGTYDVIAQQLSTESPQRTERVQVLRDVVVEDGEAPIPIDIDQFGLPPAEATVTIGGATPSFVDLVGMTGNDTWFRFFGRSVVVLPVELTRPDDRQLATLYDGDAWAEVPVHAGANDVALPADTVDATFTHVSPPAVTWRSTTEWELVTFQMTQWTTSGPGLPRWRILAYPGAFAATDDGTALVVDLPVPDVAGWQPGWMTNLATEHLLYATWQRARDDGGRGGVAKSARQ